MNEREKVLLFYFLFKSFLVELVKQWTHVMSGPASPAVHAL